MSLALHVGKDSPSCACTPYHIEVVARPWKFLQVRLLLESPHNAIQHQQLRHPANTSAVCPLSALWCHQLQAGGAYPGPAGRAAHSPLAKTSRDVSSSEKATSNWIYNPPISIGNEQLPDMDVEISYRTGSGREVGCFTGKEVLYLSEAPSPMLSSVALGGVVACHKPRCQAV